MAPVYFLEIYKVYKALYENSEDSHENKTLLKVKQVLVDLYRNDQVLADRELHRFSVQNSNQNSKKNISDFDLCSDRLELKHPGYELDQRCRLIPGPKTSRHNFQKLKTKLLSKDLDQDAKYNPNEVLFLDGKVDLTGSRVAFQSYSSSGCTFLRRFIEQITGVFVGSDQVIDNTFLDAMKGQAGQAHVSDEKLVWLTMTNYPLVNRESIPFNAEKMICLVRTPLDIIASCAFRHCLHSDNLKPQESLNQQFPEWWDKWVRDTVENIAYSHTFIDDNLATKIPTYYIRYEDLVIDPQPVLMECFRFLLDVHSLDDTVIEARIRAVSKQGFDDNLS